MRCPKCGTPMELRKGRRGCPRCDFWKKSYGEQWWMKHAQNTKALLGELELRFPQMTWTTGLGAESGARLDIPPQRKGEPDIKGWWMRTHLVSIEVSGTDSPKISVPPDPIKIRPGKLVAAEAEQVETLFYMVYRTGTFVVTLDVLKKYRRRVSPLHVRGKYETYIEVPYHDALPRTALWGLISKALHPLEPRMALGESLGEAS